PGHDSRQGDPVAAAWPLPQITDAEHGGKGRGGVLQKNGIGGGGQLGRDDEQNRGGGIGERPADLGSRPGEAGAAEDKQNERGGYEAAHPRNCQGMPNHSLDQNSAEAPAE